jgi:hypothetical protein
MQTVTEIHLGAAFLVVLCALVFSWNQLGRRVINVVVGLQVLIGLAVAGVIGATHQPVPPTLWVHMLLAIVILGCYGMASRFGRRAGGGNVALLLSIAGLVVVLIDVYIGWRMAGLV